MKAHVPEGLRQTAASCPQVPINKRPDSKGQWHPFTIKRNSFYIRFHSENASPSYWGYRFTVSVRSVACEVALELLQAVICSAPALASSVIDNNVFTSLVSAAHRETGVKRRKILGILTAMLSRRSCLQYGRFHRPTLSSLNALRQVGARGVRRGINAPSPPHHHPRIQLTAPTPVKAATSPG